MPALARGSRVVSRNTVWYERRVQKLSACLRVVLTLAVLLGVLALPAAVRAGEPPPTYFWGAQWGTNAKPAGVGLRLVSDAEGIQSIRKQGGQPCGAPTAYYRGGYFDPGSGAAGKVTGCTIGFERLVGRFVGDKSRGFNDRGSFDIRIHVGDSDEYGITEDGSIIESGGLRFDGTANGRGGPGPWHAEFTRHFSGDGATTPVDPADAVSSLQIRLAGKQYRPLYAFVKTGAKVTICARDQFHHKPFSLSKQDAFSAHLKPGECFSTTAKNTTGAAYPWLLFDEIHAREKMVIWIVTAKA
jgi:hypothetical protein